MSLQNTKKYQNILIKFLEKKKMATFKIIKKWWTHSSGLHHGYLEIYKGIFVILKFFKDIFVFLKDKKSTLTFFDSLKVH